MKKLVFLVVSFLSFYLINMSSFSYAKVQELKMIPEDANLVIFLDVNKEDKGLANIMDMWKMRFDIKEKFSKKRDAISSIYMQLEPPHVVGATFLPDSMEREEARKKKEEVFPKYLVVVEIKGAGNQQIFEDALGVLLKKQKTLKKIKYGNFDIIYRDLELEPFHGVKDLSSYVKVKDFFLLSSDIDLLKRAIDVCEGEKNSIAENKDFLKLENDLIEDNDGYVYINNADSKFEENLREWEAEQGVTLLIESKSIKSIVFSFNLIDEDAFRGRIFFEGKSRARIDDMQDDAIFFSQTIERSLVPQGVKWASSIREKDNCIILDFDATGLKPILEKAILKDKFLKPKQAPPPVGNVEIEPKEKLALKTQLPKIIFVILIVIFVVILTLVVTRKRGKTSG